MTGTGSTGGEQPWRGRLPRVRVPAPRLTLADRFGELRRRWRTLLRLGLATSAAFAFSTHVLDHQQAFFAPVAAVIVLLAGAGLRGRLLFEVILGVAFGVLVGELLVLLIGRGPWQLALVVVLTTTTSLLAGLRGVALTQATNSAVLLAAVLPVAGAGNPALTRFTDALVGGFCALATILLLPRNAVRDIDHEVRPLLIRLEHVLEGIAAAMRDDSPERAEMALASARGLQGQVNAALTTAGNVAEIASLSPWRWGQRAAVERYAAVLDDIDNAIRDARVLARRTATMLRLGEPAGDQLARAVEVLARGVHLYQGDLAAHEGAQASREELLEAVRLAVTALEGRLTLNSAAVASQIRSLAADVLLASGMTRDELDVSLDF